jgi:hypothetical protein
MGAPRHAGVPDADRDGHGGQRVLQFGLDWVRAFKNDPVIAAAMTAFLLAGAAPAGSPRLRR